MALAKKNGRCTRYRKEMERKAENQVDSPVCKKSYKIGKTKTRQDKTLFDKKTKG